MLLSAKSQELSYSRGGQRADAPDSDPEKARGIQAAVELEKQLHRWKGEGGALLPDETSDSAFESDPAAAAAAR